MNNTIINDIISYTDFLRKNKFQISFCCFDKIFSRYMPLLLMYEVHLPSICNYMKSDSSTKKCCIRQKNLLISKTPDKPVYSCCFVGVEEYVIPIKQNNKTIVCVNISGYRGKLLKAANQAQKYARLCDEQFNFLYSDLSTNVPELDEVLQFIRPFQYMFSALYEHCEKYPSEENQTNLVYHKMLDFIYNNFMNKISCADISCALNFSQSYLRHIFIAESGMSINRFIVKLRLHKAAALLQNTQLNISQISYNCGFNDSNYFSDSFKKEYGISPKNFRKNC